MLLSYYGFEIKVQIVSNTIHFSDGGGVGDGKRENPACRGHLQRVSLSSVNI